MPLDPRPVEDALQAIHLSDEPASIAIRDLSKSQAPPGVWLPAINSATGGPQSHAIYHELATRAGMRLQRTKDGHAMVTVSEAGAVHLLAVPSPEFYRFVDRFRVARRLRVLPESALNELSRIIEARVGDPRFEDDRPLVPPDSERSAPPASPSSTAGPGPSATDLMAYTLNRVVLNSPYVLVPSAIANAIGEPERAVTTMLVENRDRLRELGFETRTVGSSVGPVFLVTRTSPKGPTSIPKAVPGVD